MAVKEEKVYDVTEIDSQDFSNFAAENVLKIHAQVQTKNSLKKAKENDRKNKMVQSKIFA